MLCSSILLQEQCENIVQADKFYSLGHVIMWVKILELSQIMKFVLRSTMTVNAAHSFKQVF